MAAGDALRFLERFLVHPGSVGAVAPSSRYLARAMVEGVELPPGGRLVEFGPGTGSFTRALRAILPSPEAYLGIECDPGFVGLLRRRFPELRFHLGGAEDAPAILEALAGGRAAAVLSGLPFASFGEGLQEQLVDSIGRILAPGGLFRTFQYVHAFPMVPARRFRRLMDTAMGSHMRGRPVFRNVPPAFVLTWRKRTEAP